MTYQIGNIVKHAKYGYITVNRVGAESLAGKLQCLTSAGNLVVVPAKSVTFFKHSTFKGI